MSTAYTGTVLNDNPIGYWRLGEPSGTTAYDASGNGYHGTYNGGFTLAQAGPIVSDNNTSTLFNGTTGNVSIPSSFSMTNFANFSVECWVKLTSATFAQSPRLVANSHSDVDFHGFELYFLNNAASINFVAGNGGSSANANWVNAFAAGTWYHIVGTFNSSTLTVYVNGVSRATASLSGNINTPNSNLALAYADTYNGDFLPGNLDEVAVYNYALTSTQVTNHYNAALAANFNLYQIPPYTKNRVIQPEDINQVIYTLHQPSGGQELGHYFLAGNGYVLNAVVSWYVPSLSRGSAPVSVTLDASDSANSNLNTSPPSTDHLTANGFHIFDFTNGVHTDASIGGKYTIQY